MPHAPRFLPALFLLALLAVAPVLGEDAWRDEGTDASAWRAQPNWTGNASPRASVHSENGVLLFTVPEAGKGMKFSRAVRPFPLSWYRYLVLRYRAENLRSESDDYFVYLDDGNPAQCRPLRLRDVISDGAWHTVAVDASRLSSGTAGALAVQVAASAPGGRLALDFIRFTDALPPDAQEFGAPAASAAPARPDWSLPLAAPGWAAHRDWLANPADDPAVSGDADGLTFRVTGSHRGMKWSFPLPAAAPLRDYHYLSLRYRAQGVSAAGDYALCVIGTAQGNGLDYTPALMPGSLQADGRWHTLSVDLSSAAGKIPVAREVAIQVQAGGALRASLTLADVRLTNTPPRPRLADFITSRDVWPAAMGSFVTLDTGRLPGSPTADLRKQFGIEGWFAGERVTAEGIPFRLRARGEEVCRTGMLPWGQLAVPVGRRVSEVYLLLASLFAGEEEEVRGGGPITAIEDVDRFRLRLEYADGTTSECLPLDAGAGRRRVALGPRVLCAFADPRRTLARVVVEDRATQAAFALLAASACVGERGPLDRYRLRLMQTPQTPVAKLPAPGTPYLSIAGKRIRLANACLEAVFDTSQGLRLVHLVHRGGPGEVLPAGGGSVLDAYDGKTPLPLVVKEARAMPAAAGRKEVAVTLCSETPGSGAARGLQVLLRLSIGSGAEIAIEGEAANTGAASLALSLRGPRVPGIRVGADASENYYLFPQSGAVLNNTATSLEQTFCGLFPVQFEDVSNRRAGGGVFLRTEDREGTPRTYTLRKSDQGLTEMGVAYPQRALAPGERRPLVRTLIGVHGGDWHAAFEAYRRWLGSWYRPAAPRKPWFREVFNFRQRFLWSYDPLYDAQAGKFRLESALTEGKEFGGIDYLHLFDWGNCGKYGRIYGRTGDYSPADYWAGGMGAFRSAIAGIQAKGVPVGLYIEGYLLEERGKLGQEHGKEWQRVDASGKPGYWPRSTEMFACPWVPAWREVQADTYARTVRETGVSGMYMDELGFSAPGADCYNPSHGHPVPGSAVIGERGLTQGVRARIDRTRAGIALYSEETPPDVNSAFQDGSFTYTMSRARTAPTRVPLNVLRFAIPSFKTFEILTCDHPTGTWATGVYWTFFNGEGIWLEGPASGWFEPQTLAAIRKCHALLRANKDAFAGDSVEPLVPAQIEGVFANRFRAKGKEVYTLYNSHPETLTAEVLRLPYRPGRRYEDAWNGRVLHPRVIGGQAYLRLTLGPQEPGCVVITDR